MMWIHIGKQNLVLFNAWRTAYAEPYRTDPSEEWV
jgi:hypothetical protein